MFMIDTMKNTIQKGLLATQRGEPKRSGGEPNGVANNSANAPSTPNSEVRAQQERRRFTAKYRCELSKRLKNAPSPGR